MKKGYKTTLCWITSIVAAESASKAKAITCRSAKEAGYQLDYREIRALRYPVADEWASSGLGTDMCWSPEHWEWAWQKRG